MEDFRDKIKNYKAVPSKNAWSDFELKTDVLGINKLKKLNYLFLAMNLVTLLSLLGLLLKSNSQKISFYNVEKEVVRLQQVESQLHESIASCDSLNHELENRIDLLNLELLTSKEQDLLSKTNQISDLSEPKFENEEIAIQIPDVQSTKQLIHIQTKADLRNAIAETLNPAQTTNERVNRISKLSKSSIYPLPMNTLGTNEIRLFAVNNKPWIDLKNQIPKSIRFSTGIGVSKDIFSRYGSHYMISMSRDILRRFSLGLRAGYSKTQESVNYTLFEEVKDHELEASTHVYLRYLPFSYRNLEFNIDLGIGGSHFSRSYRKNRFEDNELTYYDSAISFTGLSIMASAGLSYELSNRFGIELLYSTYYSEQQSLSLNLNYNIFK